MKTIITILLAIFTGGCSLVGDYLLDKLGEDLTSSANYYLMKTIITILLAIFTGGCSLVGDYLLDKL